MTCNCHESANSRTCGNCQPLDPQRLSKAMRVSLDIYGWDLDAMAQAIATEYARLAGTASKEASDR